MNYLEPSRKRRSVYTVQRTLRSRDFNGEYYNFIQSSNLNAGKEIIYFHSYKADFDFIKCTYPTAIPFVCSKVTVFKN